MQMQKQQKTAQELADMITQRIDLGGIFIAVNRDPAHGWHPTVVTAPSQAIRCQQLAESIAADLRATYDLKA
jgi:hypothetical protein